MVEWISVEDAMAACAAIFEDEDRNGKTQAEARLIYAAAMGIVMPAERDPEWELTIPVPAYIALAVPAAD